jgi:dihydroxyacetone kinase-like predicted kinase
MFSCAGGCGSGAKSQVWERKYFTEAHERMLNKMVPPDDETNAEQNAQMETVPVLADLTKMTDTIDGSQFTQLMVAGYLNLQENMDRLNKENEFPIPDGDTGTNMVICMKKSVRHLIVETYKAETHFPYGASILDASQSFGDDVVMNGQGNSGTILSHFFKTLAEEIQKAGKNALSVEEFNAVLNVTGQSMNNSVPNVVEGTMISCARDGCLGLEADSMVSLVSAWSKKTQEACLATHDLLMKDGKKVLEGMKGLDGKPKVDSGASGFMTIVQGMQLACDGIMTKEAMEDADKLNPVGLQSAAGGAVLEGESRDNLDDYPYQYCTEAAISLKEGVTEEEIKAAFLEHQNAGKADSMALVCTKTLAKIHMHSNSPQEIFDLAEKFSAGKVLLKEKVEDMFVERDEARSQAYDMTNAKVHIMADAAFLPYYELDHATVIPFWIIDGIEPRVMGDKRVNIFDVANGNRLHYAEHGTPKKLDTAAPTPEQVELTFRQALDKVHNSKQCEEILCLNLSAMLSAADRNIRSAIAKNTLPQEAQQRIKIYDTGYLGPNALMTREAMRCAAKGMTMDEIIARVRHVEMRIFGLFIISSATKKNLAAWGRVVAALGPKGAIKLKPEDVEDGKVCSMGTRPVDAVKPGQVGAYTEGAYTD